MPNPNREEYISQLVPILRKHEVFTSFSDEDVARVAAGAEFVFAPQGKQIIEQGDPGNDFYVVMTGQLRAIDVSQDPPRLLNYHGPGDIVGTRSLLYDAPRAATVEVVIDARLAKYSRQDWEWLIHWQSRIEEYFKVVEREFQKRSTIDFPGRQWDEVVVAATKRHWLVLLARLVVPLTILIIPIVFLLAAEFLAETLIPENPVSRFLMLLGTVPFFIIAALLAAYNYADWRNDDFIVTSKRFVHIERRLFYGEDRDEAPLTRIQDVTVAHIGPLDRLDYFNLRVKTAGAGDISIRGVKDGDGLKDTIFSEKEQALARVRAANMASVRQLLAQRLEWEEALDEPIMAIAETEGGITKVPPTQRLPVLDYFWPRIKEVEADGVTIVWRKHYWVLLGRIILPLLLLLLFMYLTPAALFTLFPFGGVASVPTWIIIMASLLFSLGWYLWQYDGWRRDIYMATDSRVVDVESSPFRLRGEKRSEGNYFDIQNITYSIPNFFSNILNMGTVIIETAGGADTFTFHHVFNPSIIQQEIFNRMIMVQQKERDQARDAANTDMLRMFGEYQYLLEQAAARGIVRLGNSNQQE